MEPGAWNYHYCKRHIYRDLYHNRRREPSEEKIGDFVLNGFESDSYHHELSEREDVTSFLFRQLFFVNSELPGRFICRIYAGLPERYKHTASGCFVTFNKFYITYLEISRTKNTLQKAKDRVKSIYHLTTAGKSEVQFFVNRFSTGS